MSCKVMAEGHGQSDKRVEACLMLMAKVNAENRFPKQTQGKEANLECVE